MPQISRDNDPYAEIEDFIRDTWFDLKDEFKLNKFPVKPQIYLATEASIIKNALKQFGTDMEFEKLPVASIIHFIDRTMSLRDHIASTYYELSTERRKRPEVKEVRVTLLVNSLLHMTMLNLHQMNVFKKYLEHVIRHEVGHILTTFDIPKKYTTYLNYWKATSCDRAAKKKWRKEKEECEMDNEEQVRFYYSIPSEKEANDRVGITIEEIIEFDKIILTPSYK